jgi:hypothetical protein
MAHLVLPSQVFAALALFGLIWLVQIVQYPAFAKVPSDSFIAYHQAHTRNIGIVVIPLMLAELITVCWLVIDPVTRNHQTWPLFVLTATVWLSTFLLQVPCHNRLARGKDDAVIRRLVRTNWIRTLGWTIKALLIFVWYL